MGYNEENTFLGTSLFEKQVEEFNFSFDNSYFIYEESGKPSKIEYREVPKSLRAKIELYRAAERENKLLP